MPENSKMDLNETAQSVRLIELDGLSPERATAIWNALTDDERLSMHQANLARTLKAVRVATAEKKAIEAAKTERKLYLKGIAALPGHDLDLGLAFYDAMKAREAAVDALIEADGDSIESLWPSFECSGCKRSLHIATKRESKPDLCLWCLKIAGLKERVTEAAKAWNEARHMFHGYADMGEGGEVLESAYQNAENALVAAVDALIEAEAE